MDKGYFVLDFAHSLHGPVKRIQISYKTLAYSACLLASIALVLFVLFSSYVLMSWKVTNYEHMRADLDGLRTRYVELQKQARQNNQQIASLETLAGEVSVAYGINSSRGDMDGEPMDADSEPNLRTSLEQYNFLQSASFSQIYHQYAYRWQAHNEPSLWPLVGALRSSFGARSDPFSGEGAFHTGLDLQAQRGTPVHVTADGVVQRAGWSGKFGKLVVVDHGNGIDTYYAHLSQFSVVPGQEVRRGEVIALSGSTGHATGPHLHYEVRLSGTPVNPYRYMGKAPNAQGWSASHGDLGL